MKILKCTGLSEKFSPVKFLTKSKKLLYYYFYSFLIFNNVRKEKSLLFNSDNISAVKSDISSFQNIRRKFINIKFGKVFKNSKLIKCRFEVISL